uniref:Large ribosomal subunit protein mL45 n=1 Tax=Sphenodon punctatus TaxID=8508 RepID=A0A8D0HG63_SPHPU
IFGGVESLLSPVRLAPSSLLIPVGTKKLYSLPSSVRLKSTTPAGQRVRSAKNVITSERLQRPITITSTGGIVDPYVPPEGDARLSSMSKGGLKQKAQQIRQSAASQLAIRKIKSSDLNFSTKTFPEKAQEIFIEAQNCLTNFDEDRLHALVTEHCYPQMVRGNKYKTICWSFVESLEPSRVVQVRCSEMLTKVNLFGQVTVRMHTRQILAIYDRFGRLMYGGEEVPKDVLEYVVFERQLPNPYGAWRLHGKIVPAWAPPKDPIIKVTCLSKAS